MRSCAAQELITTLQGRVEDQENVIRRLRARLVRLGTSPADLNALITDTKSAVAAGGASGGAAAAASGGPGAAGSPRSKRQ